MSRTAGSITFAAAVLASFAGAALVAPTGAEARSHTFVGLSLFVPVYPAPVYRPYPYYPPYYAPVYYPTVVTPPPCQQGLWRQGDGSVVRGVACLGPDGYWRLAN